MTKDDPPGVPSFVNSASTSAWIPLMARAMGLAMHEKAPRGENPRVGCVILSEAGRVVGEGFHRGVGTPHAEVVALRQAGDQARRGTAVVTLEPCRHEGRTGPCTRALVDAGISRVVFGQCDPTSRAGGGAQELTQAGVEIVAEVCAEEVRGINREWTLAVSRGYPFVTAKMAVSLDGRVAGANGRPVPLTGGEANRWSHEVRARVQAIVTGGGTVEADDPALTVRHVPVPASGQPRRVVMAARPLSPTLRVFDGSAPTIVLDERSPIAVLRTLFDDGVRDVLLEAGPTLFRAFWQDQCIDEIEWLLAGVWLGAGPSFPDGTGIIESLTPSLVRALGQDVHVRWVRR